MMRLQVLFLALIALLAPSDQALLLVWMAVGLMGFSLGLQGVVFNFMLSKVVPVERRGALHGLRSSAAGVLLIAVSAVGGWLVDRAGFPLGYGYTFLLGFVLTSLGLVAFGLLREPDSREIHADDTAIGARMRQLPVLLRAEPQFRRFLVARLLGTAARGAMPMYIIFVSRRFGVTGLELGYLTIAFTMANSFSSLGWGALADRLGFKRVFQSALASWAAGSALLLLAPTPLTAYAVFVLVGAGLSGFQVSSQNLVLEFGTERDRAMRIALSNTGSEVCGMAGFLGAGLLADQVSLRLVFWLSMGLQLAAIALMTRVREPRRRVPPQVEL
jgi:MFS family permease